PFYTLDGMVELRNLKVGDRVAIYPFKGVEYEEPSERIIVGEDEIREGLRKELKKRGLLPLTPRNEKFPYLLKVFGYVLGDGSAFFTGGKGVIWFYGDREDLEDVREDIFKIGYTPSKVYQRERKHEIRTKYNTYRFERNEYSFKVSSRSLVELLSKLGLPLGDRASSDFVLKEYIFDLPLWQKRLFLASYFGAELSSPKTMTGNPRTFYEPILGLNKREGRVESGRLFLEELASLLSQFDIRARKISMREDYEGKKGKSHRLRLEIVSKDAESLYSKIGFEYNKRKRRLGNAALAYMREKKLAVEKREDAIRDIKKLRVLGASLGEIINEVGMNRRFVERTIYEDRGGSPRIPKDFITFKEYLKSVPQNGIVFDEIASLGKGEVEDVYDITVEDEHHNFIANNFVVSNCGVRLLRTNLRVEDVKPRIREIVDDLFVNIPSGVGSKGKIRLKGGELAEVLENGVEWAVEKGYGWEEDLEHIEENGRIEGADATRASDRAKKRGVPQLGTLGSGNHFLELQRVEEIYDAEMARAFGIEEEGQVTIMIHSGSRGCGHQICTDYLRVMEAAQKKYGIALPDRQLACAPVSSREAMDYHAAMKCGVNYAFANRQAIAHWTRESVARVLGMSEEEIGLEVVYDVAHNIAKLEEHVVDGSRRKLYVHRKGATRAFGPGTNIPAKYKKYGQPVIIPGDMGTNSYLLVGTERAMRETWGSTCHGAGRRLSRAAAKRRYYGERVKRELWEKQGIYVRAASKPLIAEEAPGAYKDVSQVVMSNHEAGISKLVVKLKPMGVAKG
ncbi:MAG: RtcB family protein, partial [Candidatus Hydrothermarchaeaceae archaeon]